MTSLDMVREFHWAYGQAVAETPHVTDSALNGLRCNLLQEELDELDAALYTHDIVGVLDALTDLQYVLDGAYLALGFANFKNAALVEVHRSNMSKLDTNGQPVLRADGKILKGPNYSPPNLRSVMGLFDLSDVAADSPVAMSDLEQSITATFDVNEGVVHEVLK